MMRELKDFKPVTNIAAQEFLSYYHGQQGAWNAMHKKYNSQIHQLHVKSGGRPLWDQTTPSSYYWMMNPGIESGMRFPKSTTSRSTRFISIQEEYHPLERQLRARTIG
jgi:hypothetical protein